MGEEEITNVEVDALAREVKGKRKRFKKKPDAPLAGVLRERSTPSLMPWEGGDLWGVYRERFKPRKRKP